MLSVSPSRSAPSRPRLDRFEKTNETLLNFNQLSGARLQHMSERFLQHTRTLLEMKRDLDSVFRRIRWGCPRRPRALPGAPQGALPALEVTRHSGAKIRNVAHFIFPVETVWVALLEGSRVPRGVCLFSFSFYWFTS